MKRRGTSLAVALLLALLGAPFGCDSDKGEVPETAQKRLEASTQQLPADTQMAFVFSDLAKFRKNATKSKATIGRIVSVGTLINPQTRAGFAKDFMGDASFGKLLEEKFWKDRGIAADGSFTVAAVDYNQVVHAYVDDKKKFEKRLGGDGTPKSVKIAGTSVKKLKNDGKPILWTYDGKLATVVYPAEEMTPPTANRPKTKVTLEKILETKEKGSLGTSSGFEKFESAIGDRPTVAYLNLDPILDNQAPNPRYKEFVEIIKNSVDGGGVVVDTKDESRILTRLWVGLTDKGKKRFDDVFRTSVQADWTKYATDQTLAALRLNLDWKALWKAFESRIPKRQARVLDTQFGKAKEKTGLDIRKDVIANLSSQAGVFVYGLGGEASPQLLGNPAKALDDLEAIYAMKFGDAEKLSKIAETVAGLSDKYMTLRPMKVGENDETVKSIQVLDLEMPPGGITQLLTGSAPTGSETDAKPKPAPVRGYIHEDTLAIAATTLSEKRVRDLLTGEGKTKAIGDVEGLDLGGKFATAERISGVYANFQRFRTIFSKLLNSRLLSRVKNIATTLQEALLSTNPGKKGLFIDLELDLEPPTEGSPKNEGE